MANSKNLADLKRLLKNESARATVQADSAYFKPPPMTSVPGVAHAIVEIPKGQRNKFEVDKHTGLIRLDRYLSGSTHYPMDYGFIPQTLAEDGDPLDVVLLVREPTFSGCLVHARVIGLLNMIEKKEQDTKVLAVPLNDPFFRDVRHLKDVPSSFLAEVEHFFNVYKQLEGGKIETLGWVGAREALAEIDRTAWMYREAKRLITHT